MFPYDAGIHVPLIARGPGITAGRVNDNLVSTIDLGPTMLSLANIDIPAHMQGRAFLGSQSAAPRDYVYATRDRYDTSYDMVRAVRDQRFKYIRNDRPDLPYLLWIPYRNRHPIMQEMWRLHMEGGLDAVQSLMFNPRPVEELYDTLEDPYEIDNLAKRPAYAKELTRLRSALDAWLSDVGDLGKIPEHEMVRQWYPEGKQPRTAAPIFIPIGAGNPGVEPIHRNTTFTAPLVIQLHCATQGASMAYTLETGDTPRWLLYSRPLRIMPKTTLRAKAIRIGYSESGETRVTVTVNTG